jgi:arylsulfatase A-like enzyme
MPNFLRCVSVLFILCVCVQPAQSAVRPNIIFLLSDDQSTYSMGCYGTPGAKTPNLDKLADDGIVFDNHYDTTAICMASRANVLTGMFEYKTGCNFEHGDLLREHWLKSYPMLLRKAGYRTAFAGKLGIEVTDAPEQKKGTLPEQDFDAWGVSPGQTSYVTKKNKSMAKYAKEFPHSTQSYGAFGREFVTESAKLKKPFCLSISFKAPHHPVDPDPMFDDIYKGMVFSKPGNYGREFGEHFSRQSRQGRQFERFHSWNYSDKYDEVMAKYFQQIYAIDYAAGMIRDAVDEAGVADNTVIIYTSDNGFLNGSHGYGSKVLPYEESSRVPLIMFDPRHGNSGKKLRCKALTGNVDFNPTILELAGVDVPGNVDGKSLLALYDDPNAAIHESLPLINVWGPDKVHSLAVVTQEWKYIYWPYAEGDFEPTEELYHLSIDPLENMNVVDRDADHEALQKMRAIYDQRVQRWKEHAVPYHNYQPFAGIFDRGTAEVPAGN